MNYSNLKIMKSPKRSNSDSDLNLPNNPFTEDIQKYYENKILDLRTNLSKSMEFGNSLVQKHLRMEEKISKITLDLDTTVDSSTSEKRFQIEIMSPKYEKIKNLYEEQKFELERLRKSNQNLRLTVMGLNRKVFNLTTKKKSISEQCNFLKKRFQSMRRRFSDSQRVRITLTKEKADLLRRLSHTCTLQSTKKNFYRRKSVFVICGDYLSPKEKTRNGNSRRGSTQSIEQEKKQEELNEKRIVEKVPVTLPQKIVNRLLETRSNSFFFGKKKQLAKMRKKRFIDEKRLYGGLENYSLNDPIEDEEGRKEIDVKQADITKFIKCLSKLKFKRIGLLNEVNDFIEDWRDLFENANKRIIQINKESEEIENKIEQKIILDLGLVGFFYRTKFKPLKEGFIYHSQVKKKKFNFSLMSGSSKNVRFLVVESKYLLMSIYKKEDQKKLMERKSLKDCRIFDYEKLNIFELHFDDGDSHIFECFSFDSKRKWVSFILNLLHLFK